MWLTFTIPDIINSITTLDFYNIRYCQKPSISVHLIISILLTQIWKAHFLFIFDEKYLNTLHALTIICEDAIIYQEKTQMQLEQ
jgi:hypothetical protein